MIHALYNRIRPFLPRKTATYHSIPVRDARLFDINTRHPGHKDVLIEAISECVTGHDHACVIGGGRGLAAVVAAQAGAHVTVLEAAREQCARTQRTIDEAGLSSSVTVRQAIVGNLVDAWGNTRDAERVSVDELPGDVWIVDIEGGEYSLVDDLTPGVIPETCIIETHPVSDMSVPRLTRSLAELFDSVSVRLPGDESTALGGPVVITSR